MYDEEDFIGRQFGKITVDSAGPRNEHGEIVWNCFCECGNELSATRHQLSKKKVVCSCEHKYKNTLYTIWNGMHKRCTNPKDKNYKYYGARGISVCERWKIFENFYEDMGERPAGKSIDRIDNDKNYCPENCKWSTAAEQNMNKRKSA